jgi:hypothetical protein
MLYPEGREHDMNVQKEAAIRATEQLDDVDDEGGLLLFLLLLERQEVVGLLGHVCGLFK